MKLLRGVITGGGVAAFFFFSWIIQLLWNSIVVDQLALVAVKLNYWQAAALWFLSIILLAWVGIGVKPSRWLRPRRRRDWERIGDRIEREIRRHATRWVEGEEGDDLGERIEGKIKRGFSRWVGVDEETDWDELGPHIERKIKEKIRDWADED